MASLAPAVCPTCTTPIPAGRAQCPGCKKVFGEDNRCDTCNAVAGVFARGGGYVCAACSAPRQCLPGTLVLGGDRASSIAPTPARASMPGQRSIRPAGAPPVTALVSRAGATGLRLFGGAAMGGGVLGAALALWLFSTQLSVVVGGAVGLVGLFGLAVGVLAWRAGGRQNASAAAEERTAREHAVLALAQQSGGVLTVTQVSQTLGWSTVAADAVLTAMSDGSRVTVEVDDDGLLSWHFRELTRRAPPRARVEADSGDLAEQPGDAAAAERRQPR